MKAIELWDAKENVFLTLKEVFSALPERASESSWEVSDYIYPDGETYFWIGGNGSDNIEKLANTHSRISGHELSSLSETSSQIVYGTFRGYDAVGDAQPWIVLHAIDSSFWCCETSDIATRQALMRSFNDVRLKER